MRLILIKRWYNFVSKENIKISSFIALQKKKLTLNKNWNIIKYKYNHIKLKNNSDYGKYNTLR